MTLAVPAGVAAPCGCVIARRHARIEACTVLTPDKTGRQIGAHLRTVRRQIAARTPKTRS